MTKRIVCVLTGPCSAGKTTVGKLLANDTRFRRSIFIEVDEIRRMVWRGYIPTVPATPTSRKQLLLAVNAALAVSKLYFAEGYQVFVEDVIEPWLVPICNSALHGIPHRTFCLLPNDSALTRRDRSRPASERMGSKCLKWQSSIQKWSQAEHWTVLDTSESSPEKTADDIIAMMRA